MQHGSLDNTPRHRQFPEFGQINARNSFNRKLMPETSPEELILKTRGCGEQLWGKMTQHPICPVSLLLTTMMTILMIFGTHWGCWVGRLNESTLEILCQHLSKCCSLAGSPLFTPVPPSPSLEKAKIQFVLFPFRHKGTWNTLKKLTNFLLAFF